MTQFSEGSGKKTPGYLFYGEETFPAHLFVKKLRISLASPELPPLERFNFQEHPWTEILDEARSPSLLFPYARVLLVESPARKKESPAYLWEKISDKDKVLLSDYFADPTPGTTLVMIYPGKLRASSPLIKFFNGLPSRPVQIRELRPLRHRELFSWIEDRFRTRGYTAAPDAVERLVDLAGSDLRMLDNEAEKIATFAGQKQRISADDVDQVSGWIKSYVEWELSEHLEKADYRQCLLILYKLLEQEGVKPVIILSLVSSFFRDILLAKLRLKEGQKDHKAIFKEIKPYIKESFHDLYRRQFRQLFDLAEGMSWRDLRHVVDRLWDLDIKLKTTNLAFHTLMEGFLFEYCWIRKYGGKNKLILPGTD